MFSAATKSGKPATAANYIEDVFSTYLYTGTGATQTINNGIDLSGGSWNSLVWIKNRTSAYSSAVVPMNNGGSWISTDSSAAYGSGGNDGPAGSSSGLGIGPSGINGFQIFVGGTPSNAINVSGQNYVSWAFRKQPKFFDVVTYTGTGANRTIAHNLGSTPGCIIVKRTDTTGNWQVYHRSLSSAANSIQLNLTNAQASAPTVWNSTAPTSTVFSVGTDATVNASGGTYVAYLFAHNAGGFGLTGTDNVISCGSYTGNGSTTGPVITLGYEPQWLMVKRVDDIESWNIADNMRGMWWGNLSTSPNSPRLRADLNNAEQVSGWVSPTSTGFQLYGPNAVAASYNAAGGTYIYIAIRRGPMKTPTSGTSVFSPITANAAAGTQQTTGFPVDMQIATGRGAGSDPAVMDRLRYLSSNSTQVAGALFTDLTNAESAAASWGVNWNNTGFGIQNAFASTSSVFWNLQRAPGFFDVVCRTGALPTVPINHNLGVVPELIIEKTRATTGDWYVWTATQYGRLNVTNAFSSSTQTMTSTTYTPLVNGAGETYVAYLFASCPGVSKVGSYTGTGATQTINCGFTAGARFVLIKRTDTTGDWYVWDTARGMVAGTDPYHLLNTSGADVNTNSVYTTTGGFQIVSTAAGINASGGSYIYLAIA